MHGQLKYTPIYKGIKRMGESAFTTAVNRLVNGAKVINDESLIRFLMPRNNKQVFVHLLFLMQWV